MKLSMWMIANRLASVMDIQADISLDAKPTLNSARFAYATNCVYVYEEKGAIVCQGENDRIRLYNVTLKEAFEIVQGVFDFYQDWEESLQNHLRKNEYQELLDKAEMIFQNPLLIMNANNKVLAMSENADLEEMDAEWRYLSQYGYSSLDSVQYMRMQSGIDFEHDGFEKFRFHANQYMQFNGLTYHIQFGDKFCGRITVLEKNREINPGDFQLIQKIASYLGPLLGESPYAGGEMHASIFYDLIFQKNYNRAELEKQLQYYQWSMEDSYQIVLLQPYTGKNMRQYLQLIRNTILKQLPQAVVLIKTPYVIIFINRVLSREQNFLAFTENLCGHQKMHIGFSLPCIGPENAAVQFEQAVNAIHYGMQEDPGEKLFRFWDYGVNYLLDAQYLADKVHACHPVVRELWKRKQESDDQLYDTLRIYLDQERSLNRTSALLFTHRNTILYRIHKCEEMLGHDLNQARVRYYIRISMYYLEETQNIQQNLDGRMPRI